MTTKNPRINVVMEKPLYYKVKHLAERDNTSLSLKVRDLVREALELEEDVELVKFTEKREKTFRRVKALRHKDVW